jgi:hypothetical protein
LKNDEWLPAAFPKNFVQIREICRPIGREDLHPPVLKKNIDVNSKGFGVKRLIILKEQMEKITNSWQTS